MQTDAVTAAVKQVAEQEILSRFRSLAADEVIEKRPGDVVTVADRLAEQALTAILRAADPSCLVVGEEGVYADPAPLAALPEAELAWVVDPVDGTRNFAAGSPDFAVMVAEVRRGVTTRAWIWQPLHDRMYIAELGAGVELNGQRLPERPVSTELVGALRGRYGRSRGDLPDGVRLVPLSGSCGIDYPRVVEGERAFLGYWSAHPWDHLPGGLMLAETGGLVATATGRTFAAGVTGRYLLAAASPQAWRTARALLPADPGRAG